MSYDRKLCGGPCGTRAVGVIAVQSIGERASNSSANRAGRR